MSDPSYHKRGRVPTLTELSASKSLPVEFLKTLGWNDTRRGVAIPYITPDSRLSSLRLRTALTGPDRFRWKKGSKAIFYGLEWLEEAKKAGFLVIVEGETDTASLLYLGIPAIGVPGVATFDSCWKICKEYIQPLIDAGIQIYVIKEPDQAGAELPGRVARYIPNAKVIPFVDIKDPNELLQSLGEDAAITFRQWMDSADEIPAPLPKNQESRRMSGDDEPVNFTHAVAVVNEPLTDTTGVKLTTLPEEVERLVSDEDDWDPISWAIYKLQNNIENCGSRRIFEHYGEHRVKSETGRPCHDYVHDCRASFPTSRLPVQRTLRKMAKVMEWKRRTLTFDKKCQLGLFWLKRFKVGHIYKFDVPFQNVDELEHTIAKAKEIAENRKDQFPDGGVQAYQVDRRRKVVTVYIFAPGYKALRKSKAGRKQKYPSEVVYEGDFNAGVAKFLKLTDGSWLKDSLLAEGELETVFIVKGKNRIVPFGKFGKVLGLFKLTLKCPVCPEQTFDKGWFDPEKHDEVEVTEGGVTYRGVVNKSPPGELKEAA